MQYWAVVLADTVLLTVALAGGVLTLVRMRRIGGSAMVLAAIACGVLVVAAIIDMIWWTQLVPAAIDAGDPDRAQTLYDSGYLVTFFLIAIGVGLLIASTNIGRPAVAPARADVAPGLNGTAPAIPQQYAPQQQAGQPVQQPAHQPQRPAQPQPAQPAHQAQPAQGWTPPQQQPGQPDWNIHSGVWSIPHGTFDAPPPDQRR